MSVSVNTPALEIPPPLSPPPPMNPATPFEIVRPEIETVTVLDVMSKIRNSGAVVLRCTVKRSAPGPVIVRFLSTTNSPLVRLTAVRHGAKLIVFPDARSKDRLSQRAGSAVIPICDRDGRRSRTGCVQQERSDHASQIETPTPKHTSVDANGEALQMTSSHKQHRTRAISRDTVFIHRVFFQ